MRDVMRALLILPVFAMLAGCAQDPFERPQTWSLPPAGLGANDSNLRAMVANPNDLAVGTGDDGSLGPLSVRPVDELLTGRRKPLPSVNASQIGAQSGQQGQQGGGGLGAGASGGTQ
jgi:hypothetical protein